VLLTFVLVFGFALYALPTTGMASEAPAVEITDPEDGATVSGIYLIKGVAWDDIEVVGVDLIFDHSIEVEATIVERIEQHWYWQYEWNTSEFDDGWHLVQARAWDNESHSPLHSIEVYVQNEVMEENHKPFVTIEYPDPGQVVSGVVTILGHAWDPDEGDQVEMVQIAIDNMEDWFNATDTSWNETWWTWSYDWNTTTVADGEHKIIARSLDGEVHSLLVDEWVIVKNELNQAPECWIAHPDHGSTVSGTITIVIAVKDDKEAISVEVKIDEGEWGKAVWDHMDGDVEVWYFEWDTTTVANGWHAIHARAYDGELYSDTDVIEVLVENELNKAPECWIEYPEHGDTVSGVVEVVIATRDDREAIKVLVRIDNGEWDDAVWDRMVGDVEVWLYEWDTTLVEDGWHHVCAKAWDGELWSDVDCKEVLVQNGEENHKPWVTIEQPEDGDVVSGVIAIRGHAGDPDEGDLVELVQIAIDNTEHWLDCFDTSGNDTWWSWVYEWDTTTVENGKHFIVARSWDGELWSNLWDVHIIVENEVENRRPIVEIVHPLNDQTVSGTVLVHGEASDPDEGDRVEVVMARINHGEWFETVDTSHDDSWSTWAFQWNTIQFENGEHCIFAKSYDGALWSEVDVVCVLVRNDNQRPEVSITHPEGGDTLEGLYLIHGTASDPDEGDRVEMVLVRIDHSAWRHATDTSPDDTFATWAYEWNTEEVDDGEHAICAKSWDGELYSEVVCVEVLVENVNNPPRVEIIHPEMGAEVSGIVLVHGAAADDRGVNGVVVRIDHGEWDEATDVSKDHSWRTWAYEWITMEFEDGWHRVCAKAWDGELWSEEDCVEVKVNNDEAGGQGVGPGENNLVEDWAFPPLMLLMALLAAVAAVLVGSHLFGLRKQ
jgi:hypothetical protein